MCLATRQQEPKIAKEDIICYKLVNIIQGKIHSAYQSTFKWELNKLYQTNIRELLPQGYGDYEYTCTFDRFSQEEYVQSLITQEEYFLKYGELPENSVKVFQLGFHSAKTIKRFSVKNEAISECVIPIGSEYYEDETGLIVSNKLIMKKIL